MNSAAEDLRPLGPSALADHLGLRRLDIEYWHREGVLRAVNNQGPPLYDVVEAARVAHRILKNRAEARLRIYDRHIQVHLGYGRWPRVTVCPQRGKCPELHNKVCDLYRREVTPHFRRWLKAFQALQAFEARQRADVCTP